MSTPSTTSPTPPPRRHQTTMFSVLPPPPTTTTSTTTNSSSSNNNTSPTHSSTTTSSTKPSTKSTLPITTSPQQQKSSSSSDKSPTTTTTTGTSPPTIPSRVGRERSGGMVSSIPPPLPPRANLRSKTTIGNSSSSSSSSTVNSANNNNMISQNIISATNIGMSAGMNIGSGVITNGHDGNVYVKSTVKSENKPAVTIVHRVPQPSKASSDPNLTELKKVSIHLTTSGTSSTTTTTTTSTTTTTTMDGPLDSKTKDSPQVTHSVAATSSTTTTTPPPLTNKSSLPKLNLQQVTSPSVGISTSSQNSPQQQQQQQQQKRDTEESMDDDNLSVHEDEGVAVPSKLPPPPPPRKKVKTEEEKEIERKELRWEVIAEIIKTEENYVEGLNHLERFYIKPLRALGSATQHVKPVITQKDLSYIFDKMTVIKSVNEGFLKQLKMLDLSFETQDEPAKSIGLFFKRTLPMFKVYTDYVNNYNSIATRVKDMMKENPSFDSYMNEMERNARKQGKVGFFSYMIQPVQRLPRYTLLVNELLKHTPESHPDYKNLCDASELSKQVSSHVNSAMNVLQNQLKMTEINSSILKLEESIGSTFIKPSRTFVLEGEDFLVSEYALGKKAKKANKCTVYLLSDLILITKKGKYSNHVYLKNELNMSTFRHPWIFYDLENNKQAFEIISEEATYVIACPTAIACNEWIEKINQNTCCNAAPGKEMRATD
ncbi:hypothetical protein C9374_007662 [Naegleria lovaniensis]|uniref:DH domain-containing protein n=1 Tax=Naegleria lovaniensis TaxID=51637 RepID=A0AA88GK63_NAELO|nr:uncharacterized protein C9374_007662 [Naegleria lovaniensis]KAG2379024.1 hypothetical protein C9374_007662 [Naegleria lovaniensis]